MTHVALTARGGAIGLARLSQPLALAVALVGLAIALQIAFGMMADVSWLIEIDERWLAGQVPYRDFFEINPPASLLLYATPVAVARGLGLPSELVVSMFGFSLCAASLALSALILRGAKLPPAVGIAGVTALMILPGETFCERDHLAAVLGVPFLSLAAARALGLQVDRRLAALAGLGAGAMAAVKPPYAVIGAFAALYLARRIGLRRTAGALEFYVAGAVGLAYVALTPVLFPAYVADTLPVGVAAYLPVRESLAALLTNPALMLGAVIVLLGALAGGARAREPTTAIFALAALGAGIAFVAQGKGWVYQAVPAMMFATLAAGFAWPRASAPAAAAAGAASAAIVVACVHTLGLALLAGVLAGAAIDGLRRGLAPTSERLAALALASVVGAACGLCEIERPLTPTLEAALRKLGPGLSIAALTDDEGLGFPLTRRIGAHWAMRSNAMIVTAGVRRLLDERPGDAALAQKLRPLAEAERQRLLQDLAARPDALLVGPTNTRLHAALWNDPDIAAILKDYRRCAVESRPDFPAELWLRKDCAERRS